MSPLRIAALAAFGLLLTACVSAEDQARMEAAQRSADRAECESIGFTPGTDAFAECLLKLREIRSQDRQTQAIQRARQDYLFSSPWPYWRPYPYRYW